MEILVGYTGFVGSNINIQHKFDRLYHSKNVTDSFGLNPDVLVYSGVSGTKFIANDNPVIDFQIIQNAIDNITNIRPRKLILISTIDVYASNNCGYEQDTHSISPLTEYGKNRRYLEQWVEENIIDYHIIRLPGIYGENIKKNLIFDLIYGVFPILDGVTYSKISENIDINELYHWDGSKYYFLDLNNVNGILNLRKKLEEMDMSPLKYTDSRGAYQYYNLKNLWKDIEIAISNNIKVLNIATEPVLAGEIVGFVKGEPFNNHINSHFPQYNMKTQFGHLFGSRTPYLSDKFQVLNDIKEFVRYQRRLKCI